MGKIKEENIEVYLGVYVLQRLWLDDLLSVIPRLCLNQVFLYNVTCNVVLYFASFPSYSCVA